MVDLSELTAELRPQNPADVLRLPFRATRSEPLGMLHPDHRGQRELFLTFLRLGLTSFGGPIAHLGYFRSEFVERKRWLDERQYAHLLALCQFLPGPASSQMGFAIGLLRGGWRGAFLAFVAFTLPSALLMFGFAAVADRWTSGYAYAAVHGLKLVAVAVVAHAIVGMARNLTPDAPRLLIAAGAALLVVATGNPWLQLLAIGLGGITGLIACRRVRAPSAGVIAMAGSPRTSAVLLAIFLVALLLALVAPARSTPTLPGIAAAFYRAGALVFGGGHVVLPLLQQTVVAPDWVGPETFLTGYGAAQAMPGPMFSLAAFLGAEIPLPMAPACAAMVALLAIFLPGFLLLAAALPLWSRVGAHPMTARAMAGMNAAVVGLLAAALYDPVWTQGVRVIPDFLIACVGFALLAWMKRGALWVVGWSMASSVLLHAFANVAA
jgi:chromate transporter